MQKVAGVQPAHNLSGGVREAVVESVIIRGTAVHDGIFEIRVSLVNDGADGLLNKANSVKYRSD
jgi:hypothetical protein